MNLIFCMAGLYQRFRDAGYGTPKFLLPFRGKTALEHVVGEMVLSAGGRGAFQNTVFVANQRDRAFEPRLRATLLGLGMSGDCIAWTGDTAGQADTALLGLAHLERMAGADALGQPALFHNIDTILIGRDYRAISSALSTADGYIDCIDSGQPQYSYVLADASGVASDIREKVVISRNATTGLYGFRTGHDYRRWHAAAGNAGTERFISGVYRAMLGAGARVVINTTHAGHETIIVGTPAEYEALATPDEARAAKAGDVVARASSTSSARLSPQGAMGAHG